MFKTKKKKNNIKTGAKAPFLLTKMTLIIYIQQKLIITTKEILKMDYGDKIKIEYQKMKLTEEDWLNNEKTALHEKQLAYENLTVVLKEAKTPLDKIQIIRNWKSVNGNAYTSDLPVAKIFEEVFKDFDYQVFDKGPENHIIIGQFDISLDYYHDTIKIKDNTNYPVIKDVRPYQQIRIDSIDMMRAFMSMDIGRPSRLKLLSKLLEWDEWYYWLRHQEELGFKTDEDWTHQYKFKIFKRAYWYLFKLIPHTFDRENMLAVVENYDKKYAEHLQALKEYPIDVAKQKELIEATKDFLETSGLGKIFDEIKADERFSISFVNLPIRTSIFR